MFENAKKLTVENQGDTVSPLRTLNKTINIGETNIRIMIDKLVIEITNHNYFIRPRRYLNYLYICKTSEEYPPYFKYPEWEVYKYKDLQTNNIVLLKVNPKLIRIHFNSEGTPLINEEVKRLINYIIADYRKTVTDIMQWDPDDDKDELIRLIMTPQPQVTEVEIAVDILDGDTYTLKEEVRSHLVKSRCRKKDFVGGLESDIKEMSGHQFFGWEQTVYMGSKYSSHPLKSYVKAPIGKPPFLRIEPKLRKPYLQRHNLTRLRSLQKFNYADYWSKNYGFYEINWDKVFKRVKGSALDTPLHILYESNKSLPTVKIFEMLKGIKDDSGKQVFHHPTRYLEPIWNELNNKIINALKEFKF
jgi:hypothetical protein